MDGNTGQPDFDIPKTNRKQNLYFDFKVRPPWAKGNCAQLTKTVTKDLQKSFDCVYDQSHYTGHFYYGTKSSIHNKADAYWAPSFGMTLIVTLPVALIGFCYLKNMLLGKAEARESQYIEVRDV